MRCDLEGILKAFMELSHVSSLEIFDHDISVFNNIGSIGEALTNFGKMVISDKALNKT